MHPFRRRFGRRIRQVKHRPRPNRAFEPRIERKRVCSALDGDAMNAPPSAFFTLDLHAIGAHRKLDARQRRPAELDTVDPHEAISRRAAHLQRAGGLGRHFLVDFRQKRSNLRRVTKRGRLHTRHEVATLPCLASSLRIVSGFDVCAHHE